MNDPRKEESVPEHATTDLPLQAQLMGSLALVFILSAVAGIVGYATFDSSSLEASAQAKATMYASNLTSQLYGAVATNDLVLAEQSIEPLLTDRNVYGVAVYTPGGRRLTGHGHYPATLVSGDTVSLDDDRVLVTLRDIPVGEGAAGHLYLALSTEHIASARFRAAQFPAMTTAVVLLFAILLALAHAFSVMMSEVVRMFEERRQMERTEKQRLETLVSERTHELEQGREQYRLVVEGTQAIPFALDVEDGHFEYIGPQGPQRLGFGEELWKQIGFLDRLMPRDRNGAVRTRIDDSKAGNFELETTVLTEDEKRVDLRWVVSCEQSDSTGQHKVLRGMMLDVTDQRRLENDLAQAQKLESVGRLAAGVAHEINTPVQFVSDSVHFVREAMDDLAEIVDKYRDLRNATQSGTGIEAAAKAAEDAEDEADLDYILTNAPVALDRARDGLGRVAAIVRSMKEFAHPDRKEMAQSDLNQAISSTLIIAANEYKYVAEVETQFADLPLVNCYAGEINQVVLNLIVNAAHAIGDVVKGTPEKGRITVTTRVLDDLVEISIGDTGKGIPVEVRSRIFDPFFTTKEVGKGTGQGLAIARAVVVDKHGGTLHFETELGKGTTFFIRLPIAGPATASTASAAA
ncbi:MAG TPA: ATP-binding protein [Steroidobacteraceae bacterium]|jgi:signal transduction histidine kinase|nr:ATP-binding protein [Steroidobacteraceae bacterium]